MEARDGAEQLAKSTKTWLDDKSSLFEIVRGRIRFRRPDLVEGRVDGRGRDRYRRRQQNKGKVYRSEWFDDLPRAFDIGSPSDETERHVRADLGGQGEIGNSSPPQHRRGIGRPPSEPGPGRDALHQTNMGSATGEGKSGRDKVVDDEIAN